MDTCAFLSSFMCPNRTLLIDGRVELKRGRKRQERHLFLFNDLFVVAQIKYNNNFKMKNKIKLSDMWTASCVSEAEGDNTDSMKSFVLGWPTVNFVATFSLTMKQCSMKRHYLRTCCIVKWEHYSKDIGNI
uniref:ARHGAP20 PH domain-containing protein n=1 Tax=Rousettus aegyptiacus TaxID=9407 RepID=A0A7J8B6P7_ROUAE|nr:hypothetical protein HJG63_010471 [Rousettus aegyptiacus]